MTLLTTVGLPNKPLMRRQRRLGAHHAALAFEAVQQRGFLAADIGAGADADFHVEGVWASRARWRRERRPRGRSRRPALIDCDGVRIFRADIDIALGRAGRDAGDRHALDQHEGIALHDHAVGEGAAVALVGIADDVFLRSPAASSTVFHLMPVGKPAPPRPRRPESVTCATISAGGMRDGLLQALQAAMRLVVVERQRIGDAAAGEGQPGLLLEERDFLGHAHDAARACRRRGNPTSNRLGTSPGVDRAIGNAAVAGRDLDQRLQPEHAARAVADDRRRRAPRAAASRAIASATSSAPTRQRAGIARDVDRHAHVRTSVDDRVEPLLVEPADRRSPSSMAAGAQAQRPRQ